MVNNGTVDAAVPICIPIGSCAADQFFNTTVEGIKRGSCADCAAASDVNCAKCPNFYYDAAAATPACTKSTVCLESEFYNDAAGTPACEACSTAGATYCGVKGGCVKYYFVETPAEGAAACTTCVDKPNVDLNAVPLDNKACACSEGFFWNSTSFACEGCQTALTTDTCSLCKGYIYKEAADPAPASCSPCSGITNSAGTFNYDTNGCDCNIGFYWKAGQCVAC